MACWVYIVKCRNGEYYTGSYRGKWIDDRIVEHNDGKYKGYTFNRRPVTLIWAEEFQSIKDAIGVERQIKGWSRRKKDAFIKGDFDLLAQYSKRP